MISMKQAAKLNQIARAELGPACRHHYYRLICGPHRFGWRTFNPHRHRLRCESCGKEKRP